MHVMLAGDNGHVMPLVVSAYSLLKHLPSDANMTIHLVTDKLKDDPKNKLKQFMTKWQDKAEFKWTEVDVKAATDSLLSKIAGHVSSGQLTKIPKHISLGIHSRFQIANLMPANVAKVLYLDTDILAASDITKLFSLEMKQPLLAVSDPYTPTLGIKMGVKQCSERYGMNPEAPFFNAGVLMLDLDYWRKNQIEQKALKYLDDNDGNVTLVDHEALNYVYYQKWEPIEPTWNWTYRPSQDSRPPEGPHNKWFFELLAKKVKPNIVRFAGHDKPWNFLSGHPDAFPYRKLMFESGWYTDSETKAMGVEKSLN